MSFFSSGYDCIIDASSKNKDNIATEESIPWHPSTGRLNNRIYSFANYMKASYIIEALKLPFH